MKRLSVLLLIALSLPACVVLQYRDVQTDFERAVRADNEQSVSPFIDPGANYGTVFESLEPKYIASLPQALRPNAWMLRAVSGWRSGDYEGARNAAAEGLRLNPPRGSRDAIILTMITGLVAEADVMRGWRDAGESLSREAYEETKSDMATAWKKLEEAGKTVGAATPASVVHYLHYQKWRVASNWRQLIGTVAPSSGSDRTEMKAWAKDNALGKEPKQAANEERDAVPDGHPLRQLIRAQGGG